MRKDTAAYGQKIKTDGLWNQHAAINIRVLHFSLFDREKLVIGIYATYINSGCMYLNFMVYWKK
jgi:hypothetical protein